MDSAQSPAKPGIGTAVTVAVLDRFISKLRSSLIERPSLSDQRSIGENEAIDTTCSGGIL